MCWNRETFVLYSVNGRQKLSSNSQQRYCHLTQTLKKIIRVSLGSACSIYPNSLLTLLQSSGLTQFSSNHNFVKMLLKVTVQNSSYSSVSGIQQHFLEQKPIWRRSVWWRFQASNLEDSAELKFYIFSIIWSGSVCRIVYATVPDLSMSKTVSTMKLCC